MNKIWRSCFVLFASLILFGCTITREVNLYPTDNKSDITVLHGQLQGHGELHGVANITMPNGEILSGEYSIAAGGSIGFGGIFGSVYGPGGLTSASGTSTSMAVSAEGEGSASLVGNRGTLMQCEFMNNNMFGHGYGACKITDGSTYRMMY